MQQKNNDVWKEVSMLTIDGTKTKVYTKYFTGTFDAASTKNVAHGITGVDNIMSVGMYIKNRCQFFNFTSFPLSEKIREKCKKLLAIRASVHRLPRPSEDHLCGIRWHNA